MLRIGQDGRPLDETRLFQLHEDIPQHLVIKDDDRLRAVNKTGLRVKYVPAGCYNTL